ncbi:uncharacterized protein LOC131426493 [Malaya genurostris]|uniref:uncharacterized protein LOC131426493 n=1 Tax=Malaya genurostris TaxID=325434 RepID=UPI0026F39377|nr:uncharacterized protein LOC131426493 [Malaya genurostris]
MQSPHYTTEQLNPAWMGHVVSVLAGSSAVGRRQWFEFVQSGKIFCNRLRTGTGLQHLLTPLSHCPRVRTQRNSQQVECLTMPSGGNKKPPHNKGSGGGKGSKTKHNNHPLSATAAGRNPVGKTHQPSQQKQQQRGHAVDLDEEPNSGFGQYLRSPEAVGMMKLFVIANTVMVFFTMAWPQVQQSLLVLKSLVLGDDEEEL